MGRHQGRGDIKMKQIFAKLNRAHSDFNQRPAGLQPDALPLSYIPIMLFFNLYLQTNLLWNKR
jgi:hypothetical protein